MNLELIESLTTSNKEACEYANKIILESQNSNYWYQYFDDFVSLLNHPNSLVRNRVITILAAIAKWDDYNEFEFVLFDYLSHVSDEKPITSRQCVKSLIEVGHAKPQLINEIIKTLTNADLSKYQDSMRSLIEKDIINTINALLQK